MCLAPPKDRCLPSPQISIFHSHITDLGDAGAGDIHDSGHERVRGRGHHRVGRRRGLPETLTLSLAPSLYSSLPLSISPKSSRSLSLPLSLTNTQAVARRSGPETRNHPGVELRGNFVSISHRCHLFEVEFVWEMTDETIYLPLYCLRGALQHEIS